MHARRWLVLAGAALVLAGIVALYGLPTSVGSPVASASPTTITAASQVASPTSIQSGLSPTTGVGPSFPTQVDGLPVLSVGAVVDLIASGTAGGRAMAVGGYWAEGEPVLGPYFPEPTQFQDFRNATHCLTEAPLRAPDAYCARTPPVLQPWVEYSAGYAAVNAASAASPGQPQGSAPMVVAIGHTSDPRLWACSLDQRDYCRNLFVIDRFALVAGVTPPLDVQSGKLTAAEIEAAATAALPAGSQLLPALPFESYGHDPRDPRLERATHADTWLVLGLTGSPDVDGTSAIDEVLIDDTDGRVLAHRSLGAEGDDHPTLLALQQTGPEGAAPRFQVDDGAGVAIRSGDLFWDRPAVLNAGHYTVRAWLPPTREAGCSISVDLVAGGEVTYRADFDASGSCNWVPANISDLPGSPSPTPSGTAAPSTIAPSPSASPLP